LSKRTAEAATSVKITIAVCHIDVYCGFQKAAVMGLSHTHSQTHTLC